MIKQRFFPLMRVSVIALVSLGFIASCGDSQPKQQPLKQKTDQSFKRATTLKGLVTDNQGPVKAGDIQATDSKKNVIATAKLQEDGHYKLDIPANTSLPLLLTVTPEESEFKELTTAVVYTSMTKFDINPLSSKIAKKAKELGGYTHANMVMAAESMVDVPDENKTTRGFKGDPTKQYGGWH